MKKFVFIALFFLSITSHASTSWILVAETSSGDQIFIDRNSIQKSGDSRTFWVLSNFKERKEGDLSSKVQRTINCRTREMIGRYYMFYDDINNMGKLTNNINNDKGKWDPIAPETIGWDFMIFVCK
jgi:hypothetical protein